MQPFGTAMVNKLKSLLFKVLKIDAYLAAVQKAYLTAYKLGLLRSNKAYQWHYFVNELLKDGDHIADIGANLGYFTNQFSKKVKHGGHLYCVEPVEPFRKQLNKLTGSKPNVTVFPFALGEENDRPVTLGIPSQFQKLGYLRHGTTTLLHGNANDRSGYSFQAVMKKGSDLFAAVPKLDYIKCDIEGYETVVFPEMRPVLEKHLPMVQLETWGEQLLTMHRFFKELGYNAYYLQKNRLRPLESKAQEVWGESDILFVHPSKQHRIASFLA